MSCIVQDSPRACSLARFLSAGPFSTCVSPADGSSSCRRLNVWMRQKSGCPPAGHLKMLLGLFQGVHSPLSWLEGAKEVHQAGMWSCPEGQRRESHVGHGAGLDSLTRFRGHALMGDDPVLCKVRHLHPKQRDLVKSRSHVYRYMAVLNKVIKVRCSPGVYDYGVNFTATATA